MHDTQYALYRTHESSESWHSTKRTKQKQWFLQKIGQLVHNKSESISTFLHYYNFFLVRDTRSNGTLAPSPHRTLAPAIKALKPFCMLFGISIGCALSRPSLAPVCACPTRSGNAGEDMEEDLDSRLRDAVALSAAFSRPFSLCHTKQKET